MQVVDTTLEKHYTVEDVAELWSITKSMVRKLFLHEPGVLKIGKPFCKYREGVNSTV